MASEQFMVGQSTLREDLQINEDTPGKLLEALLDVDQVMNETDDHGGDFTDYY